MKRWNTFRVLSLLISLIFLSISAYIIVYLLSIIFILKVIGEL